MNTNDRAIEKLVRENRDIRSKLSTAEAALAESRGELKDLREALDVAADELEHNIVRYDDHEWPRHADGICAKCVVDAALEAPHEST